MNAPLDPAQTAIKDSVVIGNTTISVHTLITLNQYAFYEVARAKSEGRDGWEKKYPKSPELELPKVSSPVAIQIKGAQSYLMRKPCQDSVSIREDPRFIVAAVSDGVSKIGGEVNIKSQSEIGASILSEAAVQLIAQDLENAREPTKKNLLDTAFLSKIYQGLLRTILADAEKNAKSYDDFRAKYSATISIFIRIKGGESIHLSIGDGVLAQESGQLEIYQDKIVRRKFAEIDKSSEKDADNLIERKKLALRTPDLVMVGLNKNGAKIADFHPTLRVNAHGLAGTEFATKTVIFGSDGLNHVLWHKPKDGAHNKHRFPLVDFVNRPAEEINIIAALYQFCLLQDDLSKEQKQEERMELIGALQDLGDRILKDPAEAIKKLAVLSSLSSHFAEDTNSLSELIFQGLQNISEQDLPRILARMAQAWRPLLKQQGLQIFASNINDDVGAVIIPATE